MCYDVILKSVFTNNENILAKMISAITGIDYNVFKDNIRLKTNELSLSRKKEGKTKTMMSTIKSMLNNKLDIDLISKITNKTKDEILEIKNNT